MKILIDLGTSRTGIAVTGERKEWLPFSAPVVRRDRAGNKGWGVFDKFIERAFFFEYLKDPAPHLVLFSRYAQIGSVVIPLSSADKDRIPGATAVPDLNLPFGSIKQDEAYARAFLGVLSQLVAAYDKSGAQWVVGRSAGGIDPRKLLPNGTLSFNEAVAVVYALMSRDAAGLQEDLANKFLLLADLGGGFLDISVAHDLQHEENAGNATIVNYGGYPLGVDRVGLAFSRESVRNPDRLLDIIAHAIRYHHWDYMSRPGAKSRGIIVLSGGGFRRLSGAKERLSRQLQSLSSTSLHFEEVDTKYLTIAGLSRMAQLVKDEGGGGDDISGRNPTFHGGKQVLPKLIKDDASWYALMERLREESF